MDVVDGDGLIMPSLTDRDKATGGIADESP